MSIDLDINNYTINDLINFFKLQQNYTNDDLRNNERDMSMKIISSNYEDNYKYDLVKFHTNHQKYIVSQDTAIVK